MAVTSSAVQPGAEPGGGSGGALVAGGAGEVATAAAGGAEVSAGLAAACPQAQRETASTAVTIAPARITTCMNPVSVTVHPGQSPCRGAHEDPAPRVL